VANVLTIGGIIVAGGGAAFWFLSRRSAEANNVAVAPAIGTDGVGLSVAGSF
jgi:hypothetical protein